VESEGEIRRQFEEIIAGLKPGELRDVDQVIAQLPGAARQEVEGTSSRSMAGHLMLLSVCHSSP